MSIQPGDEKQELNFAYLQVVAARAGFAFNRETQDYGIDGYFREIIHLPTGSYSASTKALNFQAKATINCEFIGNNSVKYRMDATAYNKLARLNQENSSPCLLILLKLPKDRLSWTDFHEEAMTLRECCYWEIIREMTSNESNITIEIPRNQLFTPKALQDLFAKLKRGVL